jgi:hypothetical protein
MPAVDNCAGAPKIGRCDDCVGAHGMPCTQHEGHAFVIIIIIKYFTI